MIVADANPLLSALLGGRARDVIFSAKFVFYASQHTLFEVEKFLPDVTVYKTADMLVLVAN